VARCEDWQEIKSYKPEFLSHAIQEAELDKELKKGEKIVKDNDFKMIG